MDLSQFDLAGRTGWGDGIARAGAESLRLAGHAIGRVPIIQVVETRHAMIQQAAGGLVRGEMVVVAGPPKVAKSTMADGLLIGALEHNPDARALVFNLETPTAVRMARILAARATGFDQYGAMLASVRVRPMLLGRLDDYEIELVKSAHDSFVRMIGDRLGFCDKMLSAKEIAAIVRAERPDVVQIDHAGLVRASGSGDGGEVAEQDAAFAEIVGALKDAGAAGLVLGEYSKAALGERRHDITSWRGSARAASIAAVFMTLHREPGSHGPTRQLSLTCHANRYGPSDLRQSAAFHGATASLTWGRVEEVSPDDDPPSAKKAKEAKKAPPLPVVTYPPPEEPDNGFGEADPY